MGQIISLLSASPIILMYSVLSKQHLSLGQDWVEGKLEKQTGRRKPGGFLSPPREPLKTSCFLLPSAIVWNINTDSCFKCFITSYDAAFSMFRRWYLDDMSRALGWWERAFEGGTRFLRVPLLSDPMLWEYPLLFAAVTMPSSNNRQKYPWTKEPK